MEKKNNIIMQIFEVKKDFLNFTEVRGIWYWHI